MPIAPSTEIPSERFVEQMGNHFLMNLIGADHAYFHVPTQAHEKALGYDASLQGFKTLVIQYKRIIPNAPPYTGRVPIDTKQLANLQARFPRAQRPYVFIGFCEHQTYGTITPLFSAGRGSELGDRIIFLDVHSPTLLKRPYRASINSCLVADAKVAGRDAFSLPDLVSKFKACDVGLVRTEKPTDLPRATESARGSLGNLSLLHAKLPNWTFDNSLKPKSPRGSA
jgi:hypothetical protein